MTRSVVPVATLFAAAARRASLSAALALAAATLPAFAADPAPQSPNTTVSEVVVTGIKASLQKAIKIKRDSDNR